MAYVVHSINVTANGTCHHEDVVADREHHGYARDLLASAGSLLLGRGTFDLFEAFWPSAATRADLPSHVVGFARDLAEKPKYIVSGRELVSTWSAVRLLRGPHLDSVREFLASTTERVVVFGSPSLGASLAAAKLVEEFHLVLQPIIGVRPPRAYERLQERQGLALIESQPFASGAIVLRYAAAA